MNGTRVPLLLAGAAIIAVPALTAVLVVQPLNQAAAQNSVAVVTADAVNSAQQDRLAELSAASGRVSALQQRAALLDAELPADPRLAAFLTELGHLAAADGVTVTAFTSSSGTAATPQGAVPQPPATPAPATVPGSPTLADASATAAGLDTVHVDVQVRGALAGVRDFIGRVQAGPRLLAVDTVSISRSVATEYTGDVAGRVFVLPAR